jgi:hypothetical protein
MGEGGLPTLPGLYHSTIQSLRDEGSSEYIRVCEVGCALTFASEAKFEIEAKISFRLEAKKKPDFT